MHLSTISLALTRIGMGGPLQGAAMLQDFTSGSQTLDPRITFSRASNATVVGKDGTIQYAPHNLLTYSEQFDNAVWGKISASISSNTATAPDGTTTADKLVENTSNAQHYIAQAFTVTSGTSYTYSVYVKASGRSRVLLLGATGFTANQAIYNLSSVSTSGISNCTASIQSVGNGWYRCIWTATATSSSSSTFHVFLDNGTTTVYTGDGISGIYLWGAQLNVGALQPYYPTTVKNLLGYTQEFDNAAWTKNNATVSANATTAPDGTLTADKLVENTANAAHQIYAVLTGTAGVTYTVSLYAKAAERARFAFGPGNAAVGSVDRLVRVNLSTGAIVSADAIFSATSITPLANGWYRVSATFTATATGTMTIGTVSRLEDGSGNQIYTGDGTSGIYLWGAQLSDSASLDPYVYNPGAAPTAAAYYGPRFDYDPVTLSPKGLLIEEQRTNIILNSQAITLATWGSSGNVTFTANSAVAPDGTQSASAVMETSAVTTSHTIGQVFTVAANTTYAASIYLKANGRDQAIVYYGLAGSPYTRVGVRVNLTTGTAVIADVGSPASATMRSITAVGNGWYRVTVAGIADTTFTTGLLEVRYFDGTTSSYTGDPSKGMYIWGGQVELGSFPTSYIPTTSAQVTRAADVATMTGANFSSWYRQDEGTLFAEVDTYETGSNSGSAVVFNCGDGSGNNLHRAFRQLDAQAVMQTLVGGVAQTTFGFGATWTDTNVRKLAYAYKLNDFAGTINNANPQTDTSGTLPVCSQLDIGLTGSSTQLNGHIRRLAYWNRRLSNAELQGVTA